jgi:hypothetical protein
MTAQSPEAINYQAVARDGSGALLSSTPLTVRLGIYSGSGGATLVYEETHSVTTNQFGLFSLKIGQGTVASGTFAGILWADDEHYLKVEADAGSGYADLGMAQLVAVPYSYYANQSSIATDMALQDLTDVSGGGQVNGDVLTWNGTDWAPAAPSVGTTPWVTAGNNIHYDQGYVGIGTAAPNAGLSLESAAGYGSAVALNNTGGGLEWRLSSWTDGTFRLVKSTGTTFSAISVEPLNGNVGIGTDAGDMALNVHRSSGISYIRLSDNTSGPTSGLRMGMSGSGNAYIINDAATKSLSFGTEGTTRMRINDAGYVGINSTAPGMMLHIRQDIANRGLRIQHETATDYWDNGIGVTTKNYKFYYNNLFRADISSTDGAYTQSSDRRLKRDIAPLGNVLDKVMQLQPSTYQYIDNAVEDPRSTGFVAQDVEPLFPDLVREVDDGYKGIVYDGFAVVSIRAIQELNEKVEQLQAELNALKNNTAERGE